MVADTLPQDDSDHRHHLQGEDTAVEAWNDMIFTGPVVHLHAPVPLVVAHDLIHRGRARLLREDAGAQVVDLAHRDAGDEARATAATAATVIGARAEA